MKDVKTSDETPQSKVAADERREITGGRCPQCKKPTAAQWRPFCSRRCSDIDLGKWLSGSYVIAGGSVDSEEDSLPDMSQIDIPDKE